MAKPRCKGDIDWPRDPMVGWYDPKQLLATGLQTLLSILFGERADYRLVEALGPEQLPFSYDKIPALQQEIWIDYVADVGDGFNSTYAVAQLLGRNAIALDGEPEALPRGRLLVLGGDGVYPTASRAAYRAKLVRPYANALPEGSVPEARRPELFAIPGNHDWYDGLGGFVDLFCHGRTIGAWKLPQKRSYFAIRLPHRTWILGIDIQLCSDIDNPQLDYFLKLLQPNEYDPDRALKPGDRVILCTAEPDWIPTAPNLPEPEHLIALETKLRDHGVSVILKIAGDHHHYRHHERSGRAKETGKGGGLGEEAPQHLIVAGGGGAFLHPTHIHDKDQIEYRDDTFVRTRTYPTAEASRRLGFTNALYFIRHNASFGLATAGAYVILSWVMPTPTIGWREGISTLPNLIVDGMVEVSDRPPALAWITLILLAFVAFTDTSKKYYKWLGGLAHGTAHLGAALVITWLGTLAIPRLMGLLPKGALGRLDPIAYRILQVAFTGSVGWVVGCFLMGLYLALSVHLFKRHWNEAYSSLQIEGYKNFLRMKLDAEGLTIWAIGLEKVPRQRDWEWQADKAGQWRWQVSPDAPQLKPEVLEKIRIPAAK